MKKDTRNKVVAASAVAVILLMLLKKKKSKDRTIRAVAVLPEGVQVFYIDDTDEIFGKNSIPDSVKAFVDGGGTVYHLSGEPLPPIDTDSAIGGVGAADKNPFYHNGKEAIKYLMKNKSGECRAALYRDDIGDIDLIWGKITDPVKQEGYGLAHIIDKHGAVISYNNTKFKIEDFIPIVINFGERKSETKDKIVFEGNGFRFVIKKKFNGEKRNWLLTAFDLT